MKRQPGELYYAIREQVFVRPAMRMRNIKGTPIHPIHILGFARGGSTIMAELIADSIEAPILWEPFTRGRKAYRAFNLNWGWEEYVPKSNATSTIDPYFEGLLDGSKWHPEHFRNQRLKRIVNSRSVVFKYCFAHNVMPYLQRKYEFPLICINRHPAQIVASRKKYKNFLHAQNLPISNALSKNSLDLFRTHEDRKNEVIQSPIGVATWRYCLNQLCIRNLEASRTLEIQFDDILHNPDALADDVQSFLGIEVDASILQRNSKTTLGKRSAEQRKQGWKNTLTYEEISEMNAICNDVFNLGIEF